MTAPVQAPEKRRPREHGPQRSGGLSYRAFAVIALLIVLLIPASWLFKREFNINRVPSAVVTSLSTNTACFPLNGGTAYYALWPIDTTAPVVITGAHLVGRGTPALSVVGYTVQTKPSMGVGGYPWGGYLVGEVGGGLDGRTQAENSGLSKLPAIVLTDGYVGVVIRSDKQHGVGRWTGMNITYMSEGATRAFTEHDGLMIRSGVTTLAHGDCGG